MNLKRIQDAPILPIVVIGGVGVAFYYVIKSGKSVTDFFRITTSKQEQAAQNIITSEPKKNPFSPLFYKQIKSKGNLKKVQLLRVSAADNLSKQLRDSIGFLNSDFSKVLAVFSQLQYKSQVSFLADYFQKKYQDDLFQYIKAGYNLLFTNTGLTQKELDTIIKYVNNLPLGLTK